MIDMGKDRDVLLEEIKDEHPRIYNEYKCSEYIMEFYRQEISNSFHACGDAEVPIVTVKVRQAYSDESDLSFGFVRWNNINEVYPQEIVERIDQMKVSASLRGEIPVIFQWDWPQDVIEDLEEDFHRQPIRHIDFIPTPFKWSSDVPPAKAAPPKKPAKTEKDLEDSLLKWLLAHGLKADNQISTSRHRMDIWIPGHCFLELKKSKVSGDDVCQALDYCNEYKRPVILVGNHISEMASRGIEAFNKAVDSEMIVFISWSGVKTYLRGLIGLK